MANTTAGTFYPTTQFTNDLSLLGQYTYKVIPSKFVTYKDIPYDRDGMDTAMDTARIADNSSHKDIKTAAWALIGTDGVTSGDINFISTDVSQGLTFCEIYVHVTGQDHTPKYYETGTVVTAENEMVNDSTDYPAGSTITFQYILLLYDLYNGDELICRDMPMGMYVLPDKQTLLVKSEELYGSGTSWATHILARVAASAISDNVGLENGDYTSLTAVLAEFGNLAAQMQEILNQKYDTLQIVKQYMTEFKNIREVNVPYISEDGEWWMVNGKPVTRVCQTGSGTGSGEGTASCDCTAIPISKINQTLK